MLELQLKPLLHIAFVSGSCSFFGLGVSVHVSLYNSPIGLLLDDFSMISKPARSNDLYKPIYLKASGSFSCEGIDGYASISFISFIFKSFF